MDERDRNPGESSEDEDAIDPMPGLGPTELTWSQKFGYSVGHVMNDLCAAVWFTYLLVYMELVIQLSNQSAGLLLMIGQVADGISTPIIGLFSQRLQFCGYGRKKSWHLLGTLCVLFSFPLIFDTCLLCQNSSSNAQLIYFSVFIIIFQFGWAAVQIPHLSLVTDLTPSSNERIGLNSLRYSWTVFSNITVYVITWLVLSIDISPKKKLSTPSPLSDDPMSFSPSFFSPVHPNSFSISEDYEKSQITPQDAPRFRLLVISILSLGAIFSFLFHFIVKEPSRLSSYNDVSSENTVNNSRQMKWSEWFTLPHFYAVSILYTSSRIVLNVTQVYIPFYIHFTLRLNMESVAYVPLMMYISGFFASLVTKSIDNIFGKTAMFASGAILSFATYLWLRLDDSSFYITYGIYFVVILLGISGSILLITAFGITNDLIGQNTSSSAFVYGMMSFFDKVTNGVTIMFIQQIHPTDDPAAEGREQFYRNVLAYAGFGGNLVAILALILLVSIPINKYTRKNGDGVIVKRDDEIDPLIDA